MKPRLLKHVLLLVSFVALTALYSCGQTHGADLSWGAPPAVTGVTVSGFNVYRSQTSGLYTFGTPFATVSATTFNFSDTTVVGGQTYFYVVTTACATCPVQESGPSNEFKATIPTSFPPALLAGKVH